jgi:hypothetical protein
MEDFTLGYLIETGIFTIGALIIFGLWLFKPASINPKVNKLASYVIGLAIILVIAFNLISKVTVRDEVTQTTSGNLSPNIAEDKGAVVIKRNSCDAQNALNASIKCYDKNL